METSKRKHRISSSSSGKDSLSSSPADKRQKESECTWEITSDDHEVFTESNMSADIAENLKLIFNKLEKLDCLETLINKTLSKLEAVETQVNQLTLRVESLESKNRVSDKVIGELQASAQFTSDTFDNLKSTQAADKDASKADMARLNREIAYLEAYSRRENLLFEGINEVSVEGENYEDTASVLRTFLSNILKVDSPEAIEFQRVHRLGRKNAKGPRIIIARFLRYSDRQRIAKLGRSLQDDQIRIYPDFPKSIQESRRRQISTLRAAKEAGKTAFFHPSKPDLLYINGKLVPE